MFQAECMVSMISSLQNDGVKEVVKLRDKRARDRSGLFVIEGYRELLRAVDAGVHIERLYICEELFLGTNEGALIERISHVVPCSREVFSKMSYRDRPDGLIAVARHLDWKLSDLNSPKLLVIAEAIEKPGNLGTILRSADAVGADGLIVVDRCTDIHNPNVVRASVGTLFTRPVIEATSEETLLFLKAKGIRTLAATPDAKAAYTEVDMSDPIAIVVGTEQLGLSDQWMDGADIRVRIPMHGVADSLNVSMATTLLLYEAVRCMSVQKSTT